MAFSFIPRKLQKVRIDLSDQHKKTNSVSKAVDNKELRDLIMSLTSMDLKRIHIRAHALSDRELALIAAYIPHNYYVVDMENLFRVMELRSDESLWGILYDSWQDSYQNTECNKFFFHSLKNNDNLISFLRMNHMGSGFFGSVLKERSIPERYLKEVTQPAVMQKMTFAERMAWFGIHEDARLFKDCRNLFYIYCRGQDYLQVNEADLLKIVENYKKNDNTMLKGFLQNFLSKLELRELQDYQIIAGYFMKLTGENTGGDKRFMDFFIDFPQEIIQKYTDWLNRCKLLKIFGQDERSSFWKQYRFVNVLRYNKSNAIVMEFKDHFAVEFLGQSTGPAYIFSRNFFKKNLQARMIQYDNARMRRELYNTNVADRYRKEHRGGWEGDLHSYIMNHNITEWLG